MLTELKKALTTTGDGAALLPYDLDPVLHEELLKLQPLAQLLSVVPAGAKTHEYNVRTSHPAAWFEGETTPANPANSVYARKSVVMKIMRIWGSVTGFAQAMDERFIDALETELIGSLEGISNALEFGQIYGCASDIGFTGDAYQYSGILARIYAYASANVIDAGGNKLELADLDNAILKAFNFRGAASDPRVWIMSKAMKLVADGLQTRVQIPLRSLELFDGKLLMDSYADIPIFESDYVTPSAASPTAALTGASSGGTLAAGTYNYRISSVSMYGEQVGGTAGTQYVASGSTSKVTIDWTGDTTAKLYMIFRQTGGTGSYYLLDIIPAKTYDAAGTVNGLVEQYVDTGAKTAITTVKPLESGEQMILLVNRNPVRGAAILGKIDDMGRPVDNLFSFVDLARTKDTYDYMIKGYLAGRVIYPELMAVVRHAKLA